MKHSIGIDISKATFDVYDGERSAQFHNTPSGFKQFKEWLSSESCHIIMEATGHYSHGLALYLHEHHITVSVINPLQIKRYAQSKLQRVKTDQQDARLLQAYGIQNKPPIWQPTPKAIADLHELIQLQELLLHQQTQLRNQANRMLTPLVKQLQHQQLESIKQQLKEIDKNIKKSLNEQPQLNESAQLLCSIPGLSELSSAKVLCAIKDISRFSSGKQVACYAGVTPMITESGSSVKGSKMSKVGHSGLRKTLYMPALAAIRHNPVLRAYSEQLKARGMAGMKRVVAVMRKLCHLIFAVLKNKTPFDPNYTNTALTS